MPGSYVLIFFILVFATLLTYIVPAGEYSEIEDPLTGKMVVDPNGFHYLEEDASVGPMDFLLSIPNGMTQNNKTIFLVILMGGAFGVIISTGALDQAIDTMIRKMGGNSLAVVPMVALFMAIAGAFLSLGNASVAFVPLGLLVARKLNLDPVVGLGITYLANYAGFGSSPMNASTALAAQDLAGLPPLSGAAFRFVVMGLIIGSTVLYVTLYAKKVRSNPAASVLDTIEWDGEIASESNKPCSGIDYIILLLLAAGCVWFAYGTTAWDYSNYHLVAILFLVAIISGILTKMSPDKIASEYIKGCKQLLSAGIIIGLATAITVVMEQGKIIHTIVHFAAEPLSQVNPGIAALLMYYVVTGFNFIITSGAIIVGAIIGF